MKMNQKLLISALVVSLFLFEGAREWAVVAESESVKLAVSAGVYRFGDFISAKGMWLRNGYGKKLVPSFTTIECRNSSCTMALNALNEGFVFPPDIFVFPAKVDENGASFTNRNAACTTTEYRIDTKTRTASAFRSLNAGAEKDGRCEGYEKEINMRLGGSSELLFDQTKAHFLPLASLVSMIFR